MDSLVVYFDERVRDGVYHGLHLGSRRVIVKEINQKDLPTKNEMCDNLKKLNNNKRFLRFFGIGEFQNRSFLIFESYSHDTTEEALFKETFSKEELFKNLRGLIKAVSWMHGSPVSFCGNINTSTVVVVKNDQGQSRLKLFIEGLGHESKNKADDLRGLGEVLEHCISLFESASPESDHLIECLKDGRCKITHLINHPTFWTTPERKLDFISAVHEGLGDDPTFIQSLPDIEQAVYDNKKGNLHLHLVRRMEMYGSIALIPNATRLGQLLCLIHRCNTHELEISKDDVGRYYNSNKKGLEEYFRVRFPNFLIEIYKLVRKTFPPRHNGFFFSEI